VTTGNGNGPKAAVYLYFERRNHCTTIPPHTLRHDTVVVQSNPHAGVKKNAGDWPLCVTMKRQQVYIGPETEGQKRTLAM